MNNMEPWEGAQFFSKSKAKKYISGSLKKRAKIVKDMKPDWYTKGMKWSQTYTVRKSVV